MLQALVDLWAGFGVALQPANLFWSFFGVLLGNMIGVLPGMGALSRASRPRVEATAAHHLPWGPHRSRVRRFARRATSR